MSEIKDQNRYGPYMTSNSAPSPFSTTSSVNTWAAFRAFSASLDDDISFTGLSDQTPQWVQIKLDQPIRIWAFRVYIRTTVSNKDAGDVPCNLWIAGSNDGTNFTELVRLNDTEITNYVQWDDSISKYTWDVSKIVEVTPSTQEEYQYYRVYFGKTVHINPNSVVTDSSTVKITLIDFFRATGTPEPSVIEVEAIQITPETLMVEIGKTAQLTATVLPEDATDKSITWESSDETLLTVTDTGLVTALTIGNGTVTVRATNGVSKTCSVTVTPKYEAVTRVELNQSALSLTVGEATQLTAIVSPENATNKTLEWTSSGPEIASVSEGMVNALNVGSTTIKAASTDGPSAECSVTVLPVLVESIVLDQSELEISVGDSSVIVATILPENATDKTVTWMSSDSATVSVNNGSITGLRVGTATITGTTSNGKTAACTVTVKEVFAQSIAITPKISTIPLGQSVQLQASILPQNTTDKTITWESSDDSIIHIEDNRAIGSALGTAVITARSSNDLTDSCEVSVVELVVESVILTQKNITLLVNQTYDLSVTINPPEANPESLIWTSSDESVAIVSNGTLTAVSEGYCRIRAAASDTVFDECIVAVTTQLDHIDPYLNTTEGMTKISDVKDDDTLLCAGAAWFKYNGVACNNIYISGNSWVGFGASTEHLKICRRDAKLYTLWRQEFTYGGKSALKFRWDGYSRYNSTSSSYKLTWELFLFEDNTFFVYVIDNPNEGTNSFDTLGGSGEFTLVAGQNNVTSYCDNPGEGKAFRLVKEKYPDKPVMPDEVIKYLIGDVNGNLYTIVNAHLSLLEKKESLSENFLTYGMDTVPQGAALLEIDNPKILYWKNKLSWIVPRIQALVSAIPPDQVVLTREIDMNDPSILGINSMTADIEGYVSITLTFDHNATWWKFDGTEWTQTTQENGMDVSTINAITTEQWANLLTLVDGGLMYRLSFVMNETSILKRFDVDYINPEG